MVRNFSKKEYLNFLYGKNWREGDFQPFFLKTSKLKKIFHRGGINLSLLSPPGYEPDMHPLIKFFEILDVCKGCLSIINNHGKKIQKRY